MNLHTTSLLIIVIMIGGACQTEKSQGNSYQSYLSKADSLAHAFVITDGHVDLPYRLRVKGFQLEREYLDLGASTQKGDFDYSRAKAGGLDAPLCLYICPPACRKLKADPGKWLIP